MHRPPDPERSRSYPRPPAIGTSAFAVSAATSEATEGRCVDDPENSASTRWVSGRTLAGHEGSYADRNETSSE